jgi:hypothetical protein
MLCFQLFKGAPVHARRFAAFAVDDARWPPQTPPDFLRLPPRTIVLRFSLTRIDQTVAVTTGEESAWTVEDSDASTAGRTDPPAPRPPVGAGRVIEANRLLDILPTFIITTAVSVEKNDAINFHPTLNAGHRTATDGPLPPETLPLDQDAGPLQPAYVEWRRVFSGALRAVVPASPAADIPPIFLLPDSCSRILPKSSGNSAGSLFPGLAETLATPSIAPVLMVLHFTRCAGLSASKSWPVFARTFDPDAFRSGSISPTGALGALRPGFAP